MACSTITGISKGCDNNRGSITALYIADQSSVTGTTVAAGVITGITMSASSTFEAIEFNRNAGNYTEDMAVELVNGATIWNQTVNVTLPRREVAKRNAIMLLAEGQRELAIIVKDGNGLYWYFPEMILTVNGGGSGENRAAGSMYTLGFTNEAQYLAYSVTSAAVTAVI